MMPPRKSAPPTAPPATPPPNGRLSPADREKRVTEMASNIGKTLHATSHEDMNEGIPWYHVAHREAQIMAAGWGRDHPISNWMRSQNPMTASWRPNRSDYSVAGPTTPWQEDLHAPQHERLRVASGVLGALSPSQDWNENMDQAWEIHEGKVTPELEHDVRNNVKDPEKVKYKEERIARATETGKGMKSARALPTRPTLTEGYKGPEGLAENIDPARKLALNGQSNANITRGLDIHQRRVSRETANKSGNSPFRLKVGTFDNNILDPWHSTGATADGRSGDIADGVNRAWGSDRGIGRPTGPAIDKYRDVEEAHARNTGDLQHYMNSDQFTGVTPEEKEMLRKEGNFTATPAMVQSSTWLGDKHADIAYQTGDPSRTNTTGHARATRPKPLGHGPDDKAVW